MGLNRPPGDYTRAAFTTEEFLDDRGEPIDYGQRWDFETGPPEDTYSVTKHPERFEPLQAVAEGLIDYLLQHYAVTVVRTASVRLIPALGAGVCFTLTDPPFSGVRVSAGLLTRLAFPHCGCDACDEDLLDSIENLEAFVFAVVRGDFAEWRRGRMVGYSVYLDGAEVGGASQKVTGKALRAARRLPGRYSAWPRLTDALG